MGEKRGEYIWNCVEGGVYGWFYHGGSGAWYDWNLARHCWEMYLTEPRFVDSGEKKDSRPRRPRREHSRGRDKVRDWERQVPRNVEYDYRQRPPRGRSRHESRHGRGRRHEGEYRDAQEDYGYQDKYPRQPEPHGRSPYISDKADEYIYNPPPNRKRQKSSGRVEAELNKTLKEIEVQKKWNADLERKQANEDIRAITERVFGLPPAEVSTEWIDEMEMERERKYYY